MGLCDLRTATIIGQVTMKKHEVPQDDANLLEGKFKVVKYAVNESGEYELVKSVGWEPENIVLEQAWEVINERVAEAKKRVLNGELSSLAYHMEKNMMDVNLLADYMNLSARKVRSHLQPSEFANLDAQTMSKYAEVLQITVEQLKTTES